MLCTNTTSYGAFDSSFASSVVVTCTRSPNSATSLGGVLVHVCIVQRKQNDPFVKQLFVCPCLPPPLAFFCPCAFQIRAVTRHGHYFGFFDFRLVLNIAALLSIVVQEFAFQARFSPHRKKHAFFHAFLCDF